MDITVKTGSLKDEKTDLAVVGLYEGQTTLEGNAEGLDAALNGQISQLIKDGDIKGKPKEVTLLYSDGKAAFKRLMLVGLGKKEKSTPDGIRIAAGTVARRAKELGVKAYSSEVYGSGVNSITPDEAAQALVEGTELSAYEFQELKSEKNQNNRIDKVTLVVEKTVQKEIEKAAEAGHAIASGVYLTRDLVNYPANYATPSFMAQQALAMAKKHNILCRVLEVADMQKLGMGALLAIAQGSDQPAKFIVLDYNADRKDMDTIVLVGKGITFDSGGISIKPAEHMEEMKGDMAGGAAVIGALQAASLLALPLHVVGLIPASENLPSGKAIKPGDVVTAMNGKTIEIISTDAEGRMLLADTLCYANEFKPKAVIDIATLTGARITALGDHAIGMFSNNDDLANKIDAAGKETYERVWRMPLFEEYGEALKSFVADVKHTGGRSGAMITAAFFLSKFTAYPWAHLDIAGLASTDKEGPYNSKWATGIGTRLLVQFLRAWAGK